MREQAISDTRRVKVARVKYGRRHRSVLAENSQRVFDNKISYLVSLEVRNSIATFFSRPLTEAGMSRISEHHVGVAVLQILAAEPHGRATVRKIKQEVPNYVRLSSQDQAGSLTRNNEELWEQQVRNLKSHSGTPGNIFCDGYVVQIARGLWEITSLGRRRIARAA